MTAAMKSPRFRRAAGIVLVLAYLLAVPGIAPVTLGMFAHGGHHHEHEDHDHEVQLALVDGQFDLVLHHAHEEAGLERLPEAGVPCLSDNDDEDGHGDHVFPSCSSGLLPTSDAAKVLVTQVLFATLSWSVVPMPTVPSHATSDPLLRGRPPPGALAVATIIRTTVFLV